MRFWLIPLFLSSALLASQPEAIFPATYQGGSLPFRQDKVAASFDHGFLVFVQHGRRVTVPLENITGISCNSDVHRRFGASVLGVVPWVHWDKTETNYVGVTWKAGSRNVEVLFKLDSREYRDFLRALEASTGKKAVNPRQVPVVVHYGLSPTTI